MKKQMQFAILIIVCLVTLSGCSAMTSGSTKPTSIAVISGIASTNDSQVVAVLKEAQAINAVANPTPYAPLVNEVLTGLIALGSALGGWMLRHKTAKAQIAAALATPVPVDPQAKLN